MIGCKQNKLKTCMSAPMSLDNVKLTCFCHFCSPVHGEKTAFVLRRPHTLGRWWEYFCKCPHNHYIVWLTKWPDPCTTCFFLRQCQVLKMTLTEEGESIYYDICEYLIYLKVSNVDNWKYKKAKIKYNLITSDLKHNINTILILKIPKNLNAKRQNQIKSNIGKKKSKLAFFHWKPSSPPN